MNNTAVTAAGELYFVGFDFLKHSLAYRSLCRGTALNNRKARKVDLVFISDSRPMGETHVASSRKVYMCEGQKRKCCYL